MSVPASIFRAYDIRGVVDETLTEQAVELIGRAFAAEAQARGIHRTVVGRDGRLSGPRLVAALARGLAAGGLDVVDVGMVPTPVVYYATHALETGTGIAVTGSHNPPEYNGLKMVLGGETLSGEAVQNLYRRIQRGEFSSGTGHISESEILPSYRRRILDDVTLARRLRIAVDCGNGVAGAIAPELLEALGCDVVALFAEVDGTFPNHHPNPSVPENLADLIDAVVSQGLDVGLAFDGDGDRLGVVDGNGRAVWADRQMILFAQDILARQQGTIIYDVKCSRHLGDAIEAAGGNALMWKTGHSLIKAKMQETGALLAGEMSGHLFFKERWYGFDDGIYAAARLLEILAGRSEAPTEVFAGLPDSINTPELNVHFDEEGANFAFMDRFKAVAQFDGAVVSTLDGLRADFADGWGLVRPSNTTPSLVIRFEADSEEAMSRIKDLFREQMAKVDPDLSLPF